MNIVVHPTYIRGHVLSWVCDNYLIEATGRASGCTNFPKSSPSLADGPDAVLALRPSLRKADKVRTVSPAVE